MPFNLAECPEGWVPFAPLDGRVVVGAGAGSGLTVRSQGQAGGTETQTLSVAQMPSHSHTFNGTNFTRGGWGGTGNRDVAVGGSGAVSDLAPRGRMTATGGGAAHNIMQPFFVLTYCERK
jgi:microcystin-dependent protein